MTIQTINELLAVEPFQPFKIITASGKEYEIENPALVVMQQSQLVYCFPKSDRVTFIRLNQITAIETRQAA